MKVVSNTSPLCYLLLIEQVDILPQLFKAVTIPEAVYRELSDAGAPEMVRRWFTHPPAWLQIVAVSAVYDGALARLHPGEQDAILLAAQCSADLVLLDEKAARKAARERGLHVTGLVGILDRAATVGVVENLPHVIARLNATNFRVAPRILKSLLEKYAR
jgi:predicted nucleic acid-binding protein